MSATLPKMVFLATLIFGVQAQAQSWSLLSFSGAKPAAREGAPGVYDAASNRMIVFGGRDSKGDNLNDVWVLTNANGLGGASQWVNLIANGAAGAPAARSGHSMMYDAANNRLIIFGGCSANCAPVLNDVWVLTNANGLGGTPAWAELQPTGGPPAGRTNAAVGYDASNNRLIVFSGQDGSADPCSTFSDIWVLSNANGLGGPPAWAQGSWLALPLATPNGVNGAAATFAHGQLTTFGGMSLVNGTCTATNTFWELEQLSPSLQFGYSTFIGPGPIPEARAFASLLEDTANGHMLMFGGKDSAGNNLNDTWVMAPVWSQVTPKNAPPPGHSGQAAVLDAASQRMIVFGGEVPNGAADTTWRLTLPGISGMICTIAAGPETVRAEGLTEVMGDLILTCEGGAPTPAGQPIPEYTVTLNLNTDITSRRLEAGSELSEALAMIDEPFPAVPGPPAPPAPSPQSWQPRPILCTPLGSTCPENGTGGASEPYQNQPNVFVGTQTTTNTLQWKLPIDPPSGDIPRLIRLTNLRGNAFKLGVSTTLIPTQVNAAVSLKGEGLPPLSNVPGTIGQVFPGILTDFQSSVSISQCKPHNSSLLGGSETPTFDFNVQVTEGFAASFKVRDGWWWFTNSAPPSAPVEQNVPGFPYGTETGFYSPSLFTTEPQIGLADSGTRILVSFGMVPTGVRLFVPTTITLSGAYGEGTPQGQLQLVKTDVNGHSAPGYEPIDATKTIGTTPVVEASVSGTSQYAVYEVLYANESVQETVTIPVAVAFQNEPASGTVEATMSLAPLGTAGTANATSPVPRFGHTATAYNAFSITSCPAQP